VNGEVCEKLVVRREKLERKFGPSFILKMLVYGRWMHVGTATFRDTDVKTLDPSRARSPGSGHSDSVIGISCDSQKGSSLAKRGLEEEKKGLVLS